MNRDDAERLIATYLGTDGLELFNRWPKAWPAGGVAATLVDMLQQKIEYYWDLSETIPEYGTTARQLGNLAAEIISRADRQGR